MLRCLVCDKPIQGAKRKTRKFCSGKCRSIAFRSTKLSDGAISEQSPTFWVYQDIERVKLKSFSAYVNLLKIMALANVAITELAVQATMQAFASQGIFFNYDSEVWENGKPIDVN